MSEKMNRIRMIATTTMLATGLFVTGCGDSPVDGNGSPEQPEGEFTLFTVDDGLSDNWVTDILVDYTRGGVWFATFRGISFHHTLEDAWTTFGAESTLPSLEVNTIDFDPVTAEIWAGTASGAAYYTGEAWIETGTADSLVNRYVTSVAGIGETMWVGTLTGISIHSLDGWRTIADTAGLLDGGVNDIAMGADGIWVGTPGGIAVYDGDDWWYYGAAELPSAVVNALFRSHDGRMWVGTAGGIAVYNGVSWTHYTVEDGLPAAGVNDITETREHVIWAATDNNPVYFDGDEIAVLPLPGEAANTVVTSVEADMMTDELWFGTMAGAVRYRR